MNPEPKIDFVNSPLNYTGSKFKILSQIIPLFPENIATFYDLFAGGCSVGINATANKVVCNDLNQQVTNLMWVLKTNSIDTILRTLTAVIDSFSLSKTNKKGYLELRQAYNSGPKEWHLFYLLLCHSFGNQIRFNRGGSFNVPFGKRTFNPEIQQKLTNFVEHIKTIDIKFTNNDFRNLELNKLSSEDYIYVDHPYLITTASYNESNGWSEQHESELLQFLDKAHEKGIRFGLNNVLTHDGKTNQLLIDWSKKYNVHNLEHHYSNSNYHKKNRDKTGTQECLITNY
jgi:DNA adenine methylase Dam